jgi:hypothetical protein
MPVVTSGREEARRSKEMVCREAACRPTPTLVHS